MERQLPEKLFVIEGKAIEGILRRAVRHAILSHKRAGNTIAAWIDNQVVLIPPEQISVEDTPDTTQR